MREILRWIWRLTSKAVPWKLCALLLLFPSLSFGLSDSSVIPLEAFAGLPAVDSMKFSPSGKYLAVLRNEDGKTYLTTQLPSGADPHVVVSSDNSEYFVRWYEWVNDERLLVGIRFGASRGRTETVETRLIGVNRDGTHGNELVSPRPQNIFGGDHYSQFQDQVIGYLPDDPKHVLVSLDRYNRNIPDVYRLDVYSGSRSLIQANPGNAEGIGAVRSWFADRQGRVRVGVGMFDKTMRITVREANSDQWHELAEYDRTKERGIVPLGFDEDPNILYVRAVHQGRWAVFRIDLGKPDRPRELVLADPHLDMLGQLLYSRWLRSVVGMTHFTEQRQLYWDKRFYELQSRINRLLPGRLSSILSSTDDGKRHIVVSMSSTEAVKFYVFDKEHDRLVKLAQAYPGLLSAEMRPVKAVTIGARDGVTLPAYLTLPARQSAGAMPLIVFPHGGPHHHDQKTFNVWTQFFVSRGWAVLQINFRGSTGYGEEFERAGFQQWGLAMQDDLTDGVGWAIQQGIADSNRICILGASYGGYAALMGAIRTPDLYRCVVSIAGVSDLRKLVDDQRFYLGAEITADTKIGRWWSDRKQLGETSPAMQASKIHIPLLLLHGAADVIVPVEHSREMAEALKSAGHKEFRYVEMPMADHWLSREHNRIETFREMEMFLRAHLS